MKFLNLKSLYDTIMGSRKLRKAIFGKSEIFLLFFDFTDVVFLLSLPPPEELKREVQTFFLLTGPKPQNFLGATRWFRRVYPI